MSRMAAAAAASSTSSGSAIGSGGDDVVDPYHYTTWTPVQHSYRQLMKAIQSSYTGDRAGMFWARHRIKVEIYKYSSFPSDCPEYDRLVFISNEVSQFLEQHLAVDVDRINAHNRTLVTLSVADAKRFRREYLSKESEHRSWCMQRIKLLLQKRPPPPYPYC